jgi:hypothetical protein
VLGLSEDEAQVLADDAARRVLAQLKNAGVRGRVRVEFEIELGSGERIRDSRPGAIRKLARGEQIGASAERKERRRRAKSRGRRKPQPAGVGAATAAGGEGDAEVAGGGVNGDAPPPTRARTGAAAPAPEPVAERST